MFNVFLAICIRDFISCDWSHWSITTVPKYTYLLTRWMRFWFIVSWWKLFALLSLVKTISLVLSMLIPRPYLLLLYATRSMRYCRPFIVSPKTTVVDSFSIQEKPLRFILQRSFIKQNSLELYRKRVFRGKSWICRKAKLFWTTWLI